MGGNEEEGMRPFKVQGSFSVCTLHTRFPSALLFTTVADFEALNELDFEVP